MHLGREDTKTSLCLAKSHFKKTWLHCQVDFSGEDLRKLLSKNLGRIFFCEMEEITRDIAAVRLGVIKGHLDNEAVS